MIDPTRIGDPGIVSGGERLAIGPADDGVRGHPKKHRNNEWQHHICGPPRYEREKQPSRQGTEAEKRSYLRHASAESLLETEQRQETKRVIRDAEQTLERDRQQ